jgi:hypothetical protein
VEKYPIHFANYIGHIKRYPKTVKKLLPLFSEKLPKENNRPLGENSPNLVTLLSFSHAFTWGRCYDHNFRDFRQFSAKKIGVFLKNQC